MTKILFVLISLCGGGIALADSLALPQGNTDETVLVESTPQKGQTMQAVMHRFGKPQIQHAAVGGETPRHPPITRWDYAGFSVFFEHSHVVDSVVPDRPPPVYHSEQLQAAS